MKLSLNFDRFIRKDVLKLTLPVLIEQSLFTLMGVVNAILSAKISQETAAAIGMVDSINNIFGTFFQALAVGSTVVVAHYYGRKEKNLAQETSRQSFVITLLFSLLLTLGLFIFRYPILELLYGEAEQEVLMLSHIYFEVTLFAYPFIAISAVITGVLRGSGDTKTPAKIMIFMNVLNVILSYFLIYGLDFGPASVFTFDGFGILGAAWGITLARLVGAVFLIFVLYKHLKPDNGENLPRFRFNFELYWSVLRIGIPSSLESLAFSTGKLVSQTFVVSMGTVAAAAHYIGFSIHTLFVMPGAALGVAATTLTGQYLGRGDIKGAKDLISYLMKSGTFVLLILAFLVCFPLARPIASLYSDSQAIIDLSVFLMLLVFPFMPIWVFSFTMPSALKGAGDAKYTLLVSLISMWTVRIGLGYILAISLGFGLAGIWLGMFADWLLRALFFYLRFRSERWQTKQVIRSKAG